MYIFSFFKSLLKPRHFLPTLYFLINVGMVFLIFFFFMPFEVYPADELLNGVFLGLIGLGINLLFIMISLTPLGEWFWRLRNKIQTHAAGPDEGPLWMKALEVFNEVKEKAMTTSKSVSSKVNLYFSPTNDINAFALGHRTVVITRGLLHCNKDFMRGILAHEFGHIANGDSDLKLGINVSNFLLTIFLTVLAIFGNLIMAFLYGSRSTIANVAYWVLHFVLDIVIVGLFNLWCFVGVLVVNATSRKEEFIADEYAKNLGFGEELATSLAAIDGSGRKSNKLDLMFQTHPDTVDRIERLGYKLAG